MKLLVRNDYSFQESSINVLVGVVLGHLLKLPHPSLEYEGNAAIFILLDYLFNDIFSFVFHLIHFVYFFFHTLQFMTVRGLVFRLIFTILHPNNLQG